MNTVDNILVSWWRLFVRKSGLVWYVRKISVHDKVCWFEDAWLHKIDESTCFVYLKREVTFWYFLMHIVRRTLDGKMMISVEYCCLNESKTAGWNHYCTKYGKTRRLLFVLSLTLSISIPWSIAWVSEHFVKHDFDLSLCRVSELNSSEVSHGLCILCGCRSR